MEDTLSLPKDPVALASHLTGATERLLRTVATMDAASFPSPSLLPGWTRGHVTSHIARNADAYAGMLLGAGSGIEFPAYPSRAHRAAGIEAGAGRGPAEQLADLRDSAARLDAAVAAAPPAAWDFPIRWPNGTTCPASNLVWHRLVEVELHHVDLDAGYSPERWPEAFLRRLIAEVVSDLSPGEGATPLLLQASDLDREWRIGSAPPAVEVFGTAAELAGWLTGRGSGAGLGVEPGASLPDLPSWR